MLKITKNLIARIGTRDFWNTSPKAPTIVGQLYFALLLKEIAFDDVNCISVVCSCGRRSKPFCSLKFCNQINNCQLSTMNLETWS